MAMVFVWKLLHACWCPSYPFFLDESDTRVLTVPEWAQVHEVATQQQRSGGQSALGFSHYPGCPPVRCLPSLPVLLQLRERLSSFEA